MKIQHLLSDLHEAGPRSVAQQASMKAAATGAPQAHNPFNLKVMPGGKATGTTTTAAPTPSVKYNVPLAQVPQTKSNLPQPTVAPKTTPAAQKPTQTTTPAQAATTAPAQAAPTTASAASTAPTTAQPAQATQPAAARKPINWGNVGRGAVSAIKGVADVGSAIGSGLGQVALSPIGGAMHGYRAAAAGKKFGGGSWAGSPGPVSGATTGAADNSDEVNDLKATLQAMDARLRKAGI